MENKLTTLAYMLLQPMPLPLQTGNEANKQTNKQTNKRRQQVKQCTVCDGQQTIKGTDSETDCHTNITHRDKHCKLTSATSCQRHTTVNVTTHQSHITLGRYGFLLLQNDAIKSCKENVSSVINKKTPTSVSAALKTSLVTKFRKKWILSCELPWLMTQICSWYHQS